MSAQASGWVWSHAPQSVANSDLLVLLALADVAQPDGSNACISKPTIGRMTRLSPSSVKRALRHLQREGVIARTGDAGARYNYTSVYRIVGVSDPDKGGSL